MNAVAQDLSTKYDLSNADQVELANKELDKIRNKRLAKAQPELDELNKQYESFRAEALDRMQESPIFKNRVQLINESLNEQATPYLREWKINNLEGFGSLLKYVDNTPLAQFIAGSEQIGQSFEAAKISLKQLGVNKIKQQIDEANASNSGLGIKDDQTVYVYPDGAIDFDKSNIKRPAFITQAPSTPKEGRFDITGKLITERQGVFGEVPSKPMTFADYKKMQETKKQDFSEGIKVNLEEMKAFDDVLSLVEQPEFLDEDGATTMDVINTVFRMSPQLGISIGGGLLTPATGGSSLVASTALMFGQEYGSNYWEALKTGLREEIKEKEGIEREPTNDEIVDALINNKYQAQGEAAGWAAVSSLLEQGTALRGAKSLKGLNDSMLNLSKKLGYKDIKDMLIKTGKSDFNDMLRGGGQLLIKSGKGGINEFFTEGAQALTNQAAVSQALGGTAVDRINVKNTLEEGIAGGVMGIALPGIPGMVKGGANFIRQTAYKASIGNVEAKKFDKFFKDAALSLQDLYNNGKITQEEYQQQSQEVANLKNSALKIPKNFGPKARQKSLDLMLERQKLQTKIKNEDEAFTGPAKERIKEINTELGNIQAVETATRAAVKAVEKADIDIEVKELKDSEEVADFLIKQDPNITESKAKEAGRQRGFILSDGKTIVINKDVASKEGAVTTAAHEILHGVLFNTLNKGDESAFALANAIKMQLSNISTEDFKNSDLAARIEQYKADPDINEATKAEEVLTLFSEALATGDIKFNENVFTKIKDFVRRVLQNAGFSNIDFNDSKDVYNFIKDYNKSVSKGKFTKAQIKAAKEGVVISERLKDRVKDVAEKGVDETILKFSKSEVTDLAKQYKADPAKTDVEQLVKQYNNVALKALGYDISKGTIAPEEAISFVNKEFDSILRRYDGSTEFSTWINSNIRPKRQAFYEEQIGKESETTSIDSEQARQVVDESEDTTDDRTEKEIRQAERKTKVAKRLNLEDKAVKEVSEKVKDVDLSKVNYKTLKNLANETIGEAFGISPKKILSNANLTKGEIASAQRYIKNNVDLLKALLPDGYNKDFKSTGVPKVLLEKFYNKRSVRAKTGAGLNVQTKKPNIGSNEFLEVFGFVEGKPTRDDRNISARIIALANQTGKAITNQTVREQLQKDGMPIEALRTIRSGTPVGMFSRTAKNLDLESQRSVGDKMLEKEFLDLASKFRDKGKSNWFSEALVDVSSIDFRKTNNLTPKILRDIGLQMQQEFDPNNSWKDYVKKAVEIQLEEAEIGIYSTIEQIAKARGHSVVTGRDAYASLDNLNVLRSEVTTLLNDLKESGISESDISKYILPSLASAYKMGKFKLKNNNKAPNIALTESDITEDSGSVRQGIYGSSLDAKENSGIVSKDKVSGQVWKHKTWYIKDLSLKQRKKYGVKKFNKLPLSKRSEFIKKEIQPEGLKAKKALNLVAKEMANMVSKNKLSPQTAAVFIDLQFARMDGLGKLASDVRFIPFNTKEELSNIFNISKNDEYVLEHTMPGNRVKLAMYNAVLGNDKKSMDLFEKELAEYHSAIIPDAFDKLVNRKDGKELYLRTSPAIRRAGDFTLSESGRYADNSRFPMSLVDVNTNKVYGQPKQLEQAVEKSRIYNNEIALSSGVQASANYKGKFFKTNEDIISDLNKIDKALTKANLINQPIKKIRVFDFDDTLATTKSDVLFTAPNGTKGKLNAEEFAKQGKELLDQGYVFDFSEFNKVTKGKPGPLLDIAKKIQAARGTEDVFVLTARAPEAQSAIKEFLDSVGLNIPLKNITGLGNSTGEAKANWMVDKAAEGYNDFYFADDALQNVEAVKESMNMLDVKSKTQLVRKNEIKFSKTSSKKLNFKTDEAGNIKSNFTINNKKYNINLDSRDNKGSFDVEFDLDGRKDITGTGDSVKVVRTVYNGLLNAIEQNPKIKKIEFSSLKSEPSRVRLYTTLMNSIAKKLGWNTDVWESNNFISPEKSSYDFEITKPRKKQVASVEKVLNVVDVKSKVQQAKFSKSKNISSDFNKLIEESTGIGAEKVFSDVKAQVRGSKAKRQRFFIPPSAEDMLGLVYTTLGKGKKGEAHLKFYQENLFDPYTKAMENLSTDRVNLMSDFKALKKELDVPKDLAKKTESGFTNEQATRVYLWNKMGEKIPGLSKTDLKELNDIVENNPKLKVFADQILSITKGDGYSKPKENWAVGTITTDLIDVLNTKKRGKYLETWKQNKDLIYSKENLNKLEAAYGPKYRAAVENSLRRMESGSNRLGGGNQLSNKVLDYINNSTGAIMFFNTRSAILQTISAANFVNWSFNNPFKAGKAFANQPQYWKDFIELMNSDYLKDRRNGLKLNINESEIANAAKTSGNKAKAALNYILEKGYAPTKYADSFAIASGGATFYRNRINDLIKNEGKTEAEAKEIAMKEFRQVSEISQQSSDPSKISQQQSSDLGRIVLQFANTPMQYARIQKRAVQDIINRRGDLKTNISKIAYYGFLQNMLFNALQQGIFALGFGDDEIDEKEESKLIKAANGMLDSSLRGLGMAGVTVQVLKNLGIDIYDRSKRDRPEYSDSYKKLLDFSPAVKSKLGKFQSAAYPFDSKKRRAEVFEKGFSLDNPAYESMAKVVTGTTNLPLDRMYSKVNNLSAAMDQETETWQSIAMVLGWPEWQVKPEPKKKKRKKKKSAFGSSSFSTSSFANSSFK